MIQQSHFWAYTQWKPELRLKYPSVHCSTAYNSQDMEATSMSISRQMGENDVAHTQWSITQLLKRTHLNQFLMRWMTLESIIQSEVSQKEKHQYSILTHTYGI